MGEQAYQGKTDQRVDVVGDGTHVPVVKIYGGTSSQSSVNFEDELYTVIKTWAGLAVNSTVTYRRENNSSTGRSDAYWVNAADVTIADPPSPIGDYVQSAFPAKQIAVLLVVDAASVVWRQFTNTANGGVTYYPINGSTPGTPTGAIKPYGGAERTTLCPIAFVSGTATYTLPSAPTSMSGAALTVTNINYTTNGVDYTVSGLTLTILNSAVLACPTGTAMSFTYTS